MESDYASHSGWFCARVTVENVTRMAHGSGCEIRVEKPARTFA